MLMLLMLACAPPTRFIDPAPAMRACAEGLTDECADTMLDDARYTGTNRDAVAAGLHELLTVSPHWYVDSLSSWIEMDSAGPKGTWVASTYERRVTLHDPGTHSARLLAIAFVHESAHARHPIGAQHVDCAWAGGCDDGEATDGYPLIVAFLEEAAWTDEDSQTHLRNARARAGW